MRYFDHRWNTAGIVRWLQRQAADANNVCDMRQQVDQRKCLRCTAYHIPTGNKILLTRDVGHHSAGWWKSPDYERCKHLSVSFVDPESGEPRQQDKAAAWEIAQEVFRDAARLAWVEPPAFPIGKQYDVYHHRVFYADEDFTVPLLPRGEVYTRQFTEEGWLSWSDYWAERAKEEAADPASFRREYMGEFPPEEGHANPE